MNIKMTEVKEKDKEDIKKHKEMHSSSWESKTV